jgi:hypothetical protein
MSFNSHLPETNNVIPHDKLIEDVRTDLNLSSMFWSNAD